MYGEIYMLLYLNALVTYISLNLNNRKKFLDIYDIIPLNSLVKILYDC